MTLQNLELKGKKAQFDWIKPFDAIALRASRQSWLPAPENSILPGFDEIFAAFENVAYIGELRQRWTEIKKLLRGAPPAAMPASMRA